MTESSWVDIGGGYIASKQESTTMARQNVLEAVRSLQALMDTISQSRSALEEALRMAETTDVRKILHRHGLEDMITPDLMQEVYGSLIDARSATRKVLAMIAPENDGLLIHLCALQEAAKHENKEDKS